MVKLITYNIEYCRGYKGHIWEYLKFWQLWTAPKEITKDMAKALRKINPDILALIEINMEDIPTRKSEVTFFKKLLGMKYDVRKVKYPFKGWLKLIKYIPLMKQQGNALLSRYKMSKVKHHYLHEGTKRLVLEATMHCPKKVTLFLVHLALGYHARKKQLNEIAKIVNKVNNPVMVVGDFNTLHGKKELTSFLKKTKLKSTFKNVMTQPTCHPTRSLDYVLHSKKIKIKKHKLLKWQFSDHLPLMVEFTIHT